MAPASPSSLCLYSLQLLPSRDRSLFFTGCQEWDTDLTREGRHAWKAAISSCLLGRSKAWLQGRHLHPEWPAASWPLSPEETGFVPDTYQKPKDPKPHLHPPLFLFGGRTQVSWASRAGFPDFSCSEPMGVSPPGMPSPHLG